MSNDIKVYLFYVKKEKDLYAFTINKDYKEKFLFQRNTDCIHLKKTKMTEIEYKAFSHKYRNCMLREIPISTSINEYEMIISNDKEEDILMSASSRLDNIMEEIYHSLSENTDLKTKYMDSIEYLTRTSFMKHNKNTKTKDLISTSNLLFLFTQLFKNTFERIDNDE